MPAATCAAKIGDSLNVVGFGSPYVLQSKEPLNGGAVVGAAGAAAGAAGAGFAAGAGAGFAAGAGAGFAAGAAVAAGAAAGAAVSSSEPHAMVASSASMTTLSPNNRHFFINTPLFSIVLVYPAC